MQDTRAALDEFQVSSRELEEELEKELQTTEKAYSDLKARCEQYRGDAEEWKVKKKVTQISFNSSIGTISVNIRILNMSKILPWYKCNEKLIS